MEVLRGKRAQPIVTADIMQIFCSVLSFFLTFLLFHFLTEIRTVFSSVKTGAICLKLHTQPAEWTVSVIRIKTFHEMIPTSDVTAPAMWQPRGPGTACRLVSGRRHLCPYVQAPAQNTTFYQKLSRQLLPHMRNCIRFVPRIPSFRLTLLSVLAVILTLRHLNQFFDV